MGEDRSQFDVLERELSTSVLHGGAGFCGVIQQDYAIGGVTHYWQKGSRLKIALDFDDLGALRASDVKDSIEEQVNQVRAVTDGLTFDLFGSTLGANLVCKLARLDGRNGVLAQCGIPPPNASPENTQLRMDIDTGEVWQLFTNNGVSGAIDFGRVWLHEFLHFLGLGHQPPSIATPALIQAMYSPLIWLLQNADKGEVVRRYGGKAIAPPPPTGAPAEIPIVVTATTPWGEYTAKGPMKRK